MKELDYIVVGLGIAGLTFCEQLIKNKKTFIVFDTGKYTSTLVSAGVINPVVLKRFTPVWNAKEHIHSSIKFYNHLSEKLEVSLLKGIPMLRIFKSIEEQNNWMVASDKNELSEFLHSKIVKNDNQYINAPYGFGKVKSTGRINPIQLIQIYKEYLLKSNQFRNEKFEYENLKKENNQIQYKDIIANKIVFSEGYSAKDNPYFPQNIKEGNEQLIIKNKGEYVLIKAPDLKLDAMLKTSLFIIPLGNDIYKVGATYDREDDSIKTTKNAKTEMVSKLTKIINCPFEIVDQVAGIRPTTRDRRPFLGTLNNSEQIVFFNGLGTRGITSAPSLAELLYNHIENGVTLPKEVDIKRHYNW
ncbi:MAG: FAD-dependent oxidoreductase [Flavobacteriaceae bacterium]